MKKCVLSALFLAAVISVFAAERGTVLPAQGSYPGAGGVTELEIVHDLGGGAYILYISGGEAGIVRKTEREGLQAYTPEGYSAGAGTKARDLRGFTGGFEQYTAFIGREGDREELFLFGINYKGALIYYPLRETGTTGTIISYYLAAGTRGDALIFIHSGERLYCLSGAGSAEGVKTRLPLSRPGEKVGRFGIVPCSRQDVSWGWYTASADGMWRLGLFSIGESGLLVREEAGPFREEPLVFAGEGVSGAPVYTVADGGTISVYRGKGTGFFKEFSFTSPGKVKKYFTVHNGSREVGLLIAGEGEGEGDFLYMISAESASLPAARPLFPLDQGGLWDLQCTVPSSGGNEQEGRADAGRICLFYSYEGRPHAAFINFEAGLESAESFNGTIGTTGSGGTDAFVYSGGTDVPGLCILDTAAPAFLLYGYEGNSWSLRRKLVLPPEAKDRNWIPENAPPLNPFYMKAEIFTLTEQDTLFFYDPARDVFQSMEKQKHRWSRKINDLLYLALAAEDGIQLYRMGD